MMWKLDKGFIPGIVISTILTKTQNNYFIAGVDLMKFRGKDYLVTIDYYSNFWEIDYKKHDIYYHYAEATITFLAAWNTGYCLQPQFSNIWLVRSQKICNFVGTLTRNIIVIN